MISTASPSGRSRSATPKDCTTQRSGANALYAHFIGFLNPDPFSVDHSLNAILAVILGGSGTLSGPVVGAFVVVFLPEYLRVAETYRLVTYGLILVVATIFMPRGLVPLLAQGFKALAVRWRRT